MLDVITLLEFVVALSLLIIVHELGHFLACRIFKIEVEEFGLGLPSPRPIVLFKAGGTTFTFNWLLLGGFVRPKGENDPSVPGGLAGANPWVRLAVFFAGPAMNLLTGVLLLSLLFARYGDPVPDLTQVQISAVAPDSPAEAAGLLACDRVVSLDNEKVASIEMLHDLVESRAGQQVPLVYQRAGTTTEISVTPRLNPPEDQGRLGIVIGPPYTFYPISASAYLPKAFSAAYQYGYTLLSLPARLISRQIPPEQGRLIGLKGMFDTYQNIRTGETSGCLPETFNVISFFTSITMSLGLLNLLPIPALDGGRIAFLIPELVLRRRIPPRYENLVNAISFTLLIILLIYVNALDFIKPAVP